MHTLYETYQFAAEVLVSVETVRPAIAMFALATVWNRLNVVAVVDALDLGLVWYTLNAMCDILP